MEQDNLIFLVKTVYIEPLVFRLRQIIRDFVAKIFFMTHFNDI